MFPCKRNLEVIPLDIESSAIELQSPIQELGFSTDFVVGQKFRQVFALIWISIDAAGAVALGLGSIQHDIVRLLVAQVDAKDGLTLFDALVHVQARLEVALTLVVCLPGRQQIATGLAGAAPDAVESRSVTAEGIDK